MIILIDAEKSFDKIQHPFITRTLKKLGLKGMFLIIVKAIYGNRIASIIPNGELKPFPLQSRMRQGCPLSLTLFNDFGIPRKSIKTKIRHKSDTNMEISSLALFICRLHGGIFNRS
jgi:hypothetical protein